MVFIHGAWLWLIVKHLLVLRNLTINFENTAAVQKYVSVVDE
jgi:hypothetical protein